jgi:4-amino-4-deoxy-L-arabinose transferase-like glycosyltransferase
LDAASASLIVYLEAHQGAATYLFATPSAQTAAPCIIATGRPVMTLGGFSGADPILTLDQLRALIRDGQVRYFLVAGGGLGGPGGGSANSQLIQWVVAHGTVVPASAIGGSSTGGGLLYVVAASAA